MRFKTSLKTSTNLINLTPLVDVVFLMLIFFIITSDILPLKSLNIENPKIAKDSNAMTTQLLVVMDAQHVIYVGSKKAIVDFDSLKSYLQDEILKLQKQYGNVNPTVVVSVDRLAEYGSFLRLFSIVQECSARLRLAYTPMQEEDLEF